jgi:hypothetical protein
MSAGRAASCRHFVYPDSWKDPPGIQCPALSCDRISNLTFNPTSRLDFTHSKGFRM